MRPGAQTHAGGRLDFIGGRPWGLIALSVRTHLQILMNYICKIGRLFNRRICSGSLQDILFGTLEADGEIKKNNMTRAGLEPGSHGISVLLCTKSMHFTLLTYYYLEKEYGIELTKHIIIVHIYISESHTVCCYMDIYEEFR